MREPDTISRSEPQNPGLNYAYLKREGTQIIQRLAGAIWTDYNEHDPGVTTLEQVCYALTELSYRAEFPMADLLTRKNPRGGPDTIDPRLQALFIPLSIFPGNPVTEKDYRKLLVDRVPGLANVWLVPFRGRSTDGAQRLDGLYDILAYVPGGGACVCDGEEVLVDVEGEIRKVYASHRGLCEDVRRIQVLEPLTTTVHARISIDGKIPAEEILADMLLHVGQFMAPELVRSSLKSQLEEGKPSDEIFEGPRLLNGFISDCQLEPKATKIAVRDIEEVIAQTLGVKSVGRISVRVEGRAQPYFRGDSIPVGWRHILALETLPRGGRFTLRLFENGIEVFPNARKVELLLARKQAKLRRTWPLAPEYREYFAFPKGQYREVRNYYSIQNQYPLVYGIGEYGLPGEATPVRRSQAKQFKGYLLVFEQLLADYLAQLARVGDLFSVQRDLEHTYFFQYLNDSVPDVEPVLAQGPGGYLEGLPRLVDSQDPAVHRRNRFLDVLSGLYAEALDASSVALGSCSCLPSQETGERLVQAKLDLLDLLVESTGRRGAGFDYLAPDTLRDGRENVAGMVLKSRIQLGMEGPPSRPLTEALAVRGMSLTGEGVQGERLSRRHYGTIESEFLKVRTVTAAAPRATQGQLVARLSISAELVGAAASIGNYRMGMLAGEEQISLVVHVPGRTPESGSWCLLGHYRDFDEAEAACYAWTASMAELRRSLEQLYIIEHTLLRFGRKWRGGKGEAGDEGFSYAFTLTAVIATCSGREEDPGYRDFAWEVLRANTPAHIQLEILFLEPATLCEFETLYRAWEQTLAGPDWRARSRASARLRRFLVRAGEAEKER